MNLQNGVDEYQNRSGEEEEEEEDRRAHINAS
jgi:hypothetical protein